MRLSRLTSRRFLSAFLSLVFILTNSVSIVAPQKIVNQTHQNTLAPVSQAPAIAYPLTLPEGVEIEGEVKDEYLRRVLTPGALKFLTRIQREVVAGNREELLQKRMDRQARLDSGEEKLGFLEKTRNIREGNWKCNTLVPMKKDLQDRRVELTGPADKANMVFHAFNSKKKQKVRVYMTDFEDSESPEFKNQLQGQINIQDALRGELEYKGEKVPQKREDCPTLFVRPRGWHLQEAHVLVDGKPVSGGVFDFALFIYHNAKLLMDQGSAPYFYLPKMESREEARLWNQIFFLAEEMLAEEKGLPKEALYGTIKATVLIETITGAFELEEIIYELREHMAGLNCGRWDYIFNYIKRTIKASTKNNPDLVLPERAQIKMTVDFMQAYVKHLIYVCHKRGVHAMGGMAAQIPIKSNLTLESPIEGIEDAVVRKRIWTAIYKTGYFDDKGEVTKKFNAENPKLDDVDFSRAAEDLKKLGITVERVKELVIPMMQYSVYLANLDQEARKQVYIDKLREVKAGHDGTWIAHPELAKEALKAFDEFMPPDTMPNQIRPPETESSGVTAENLLKIPTGTITETGLRENIWSFLEYVGRWINGDGAVGIDYYNLDGKLRAKIMEDAATAEISRVLLWHWYHSNGKAKLVDGREITKDLIRDLLNDELKRAKARKEKQGDYKRADFDYAAKLFWKMIEDKELQEFITSKAYPDLIKPASMRKDAIDPFEAQKIELADEGIIVKAKVTEEGKSSGEEDVAAIRDHNLRILTPDAIRFAAALQRRVVANKRQKLLDDRKWRQKRFDEEGELPGFLEEAKDIREGNWKTNTLVPIPQDLQDRRVELTGPADKKNMVFHSFWGKIKHKIRVYMTDFEDSESPSFTNQLTGQENISDALDGTLEYKGENVPKNRKDCPTLIVRPRGWHLDENHVLVDGKPMSGGMFDFALFVYHNAKKLMEQGSAPYFYLPKLESRQEARLWNEAFNAAEEMLQIPRGTIKATVLIETITGAFEMEEIIYELREHMAGLNCGRWDYLFSYIKRTIKAMQKKNPDLVLPERSQIKMTVHFMDSYVKHLIHTCHKRGVHAMGGMAAQIKIKSRLNLDSPIEGIEDPAILKRIWTAIYKAGYFDDGGEVTAKFNPESPKLDVDFFRVAEDLDKLKISVDQLKDRVIPMLQYSCYLAELNKQAFDQVYKDKLREVKAGHDGTWIAQPDLAEPALRAFDEFMKTPNQINRPQPKTSGVTEEDLLRVPTGTITEQGVRENIWSFIEYVGNWINGHGAVGIDYYHLDGKLRAKLMEDAATAEISRVQLWHWYHSEGRAKLTDGRPINRALIAELLEDEIKRAIKRKDKDEDKRKDYKRIDFNFAVDLFWEMLQDDELEEFITSRAYLYLDGKPTAEKPMFNPRDVTAIQKDWDENPWWKGIERGYTPQRVLQLRDPEASSYTRSRKMAKRLRNLLGSSLFVAALGVLTGHQAVQDAHAGLEACYLSGWQVAGDNNIDLQTFPDRSIYNASSVPKVVKRINNAFAMESKKQRLQGKRFKYLPIIADGEAGFGGLLNVFNLVREMIEAGAAGVHFEDQVAAYKKCGHLGGKVLKPTAYFIKVLKMARLAADSMDVPLVLVARTDAEEADLIENIEDPRDKKFAIGVVPKKKDIGFADVVGFIGSLLRYARGIFIGDMTETNIAFGEYLFKSYRKHFFKPAGPTNYNEIIDFMKNLGDERKDAAKKAGKSKEEIAKIRVSFDDPEVEAAGIITHARAVELGYEYFWEAVREPDDHFYLTKGGLDACIKRGLAYAPHSDMLWMETKHADLKQAQKFAEAIHKEHPGKMLAYNCSPSFNWVEAFADDPEALKTFQIKLGKLGYKFQFITLAGFHQLNFGRFELALRYAKEGMAAFEGLQREEFLAAAFGFKAHKHQDFVGNKWFDLIQEIISDGKSSTTAMKGSTEEAQFTDERMKVEGDNSRAAVASSI